MQTLDWIVVALYFTVIGGVAWYAIRQDRGTTDDYFLAGRNLGWFVIGASIFASNIGSEHLVGLAGSGCTDGVALAHYELHAWCLLVLGWVFVPFYARSQVYTMPEFLERRFSTTSRYVLSIISLVAYVLTKIAVGVFAGGIVFRTLMPEARLEIFGLVLDSFWIGSILAIVLTGAYTVIGGLRAVAYTEAMQTVVLVVGSALVTLFGLRALGGWGELRTILGSDAFNLWKPLIPEGIEGTWEPVLEAGRMAWYFNGDFPWLGMLLCAPIIGLWYWCTDQYIVQRALGAPNQREARRGSIFASALKLLPVFIFIIPGMIGVALAQSGRSTAMQDALIGANGEVLVGQCQAAFPLMVQTVLPVGVRGLVVAGLLAALMSSLAGVFNASSTLFTMDLYSKFKPKASQHQLVWVGRIATAGMVLIGLLWVPVIQGAQGLYYYLQSMQGYLGAPIFVVFFFGVFWRRLNGKGCLAALVVGFGLGLFRLAVDTPSQLNPDFAYDPGTFLWIVHSTYFQYYSLFIFLVSSAVMIGVSYATEAPNLKRIEGLTYGTVTDEQLRETRASWDRRDVIGSALVLLAILMAYLYFSG
jgi:SSS family solute:Na+ symporter